jgi:TorA maturation chaperone TorD
MTAARSEMSSAMLLDAETRLALADDLALLARLHDREPDADLIATLRSAPVAQWFALRVAGADFEEACRLMSGVLADMPEPVDAASLDDLAADYAAIYLTYGYHASPAESVWVDDDGLERQEPMFAVRRWYRRLGVAAPDWRKRSDDHLVYQLQALELALRDLDNPEALPMMAAFLREHPLVWVPDFAARVVARCRHGFFAGSVLLTAVYLMRLADVLGTLLDEDMTPRIRVKAGGCGTAKTPTCADPSPAYMPGLEPGW